MIYLQLWISLAKVELAYELAIRGFVDIRNVVEMRSCLRNVLRLEKSGHSLSYLKYTFDCTDEFKIVEDEADEMALSIDNFNDKIDSGPNKKKTF